MRDVYFEWIAVIVFVFSLLVTLNSLLLQSAYVSERNKRLGSLGQLVSTPQLVYVQPRQWTLWLGAPLFSVIMAIVTAMVLAYGFGSSGNESPPIKLAFQIAQALLFVIVPAYFASLIRIYFFAMQGSLSAQTFLEATTGLVLVCLAAASLWLLCAIPGGLAPVDTQLQPVVLFFSFAIGLVPLVMFEVVRAYDRRARWLLTSVRGLDASHTAKLYDAGVRNLHNLANADPGTLFTITGLQLLWIVEWVAEAQLRVLIGATDGDLDGQQPKRLPSPKKDPDAGNAGLEASKKLDALHKLGISNILDLAMLLERPEAQKDVVLALNLTDDWTASKKNAGPSSKAISMRSMIENDPAFRVLQNYTAVLEKPPTAVDEVARAVKRVIEGPPLSNYSGFIRLSVSKQAEGESNRWRGQLVFSSKKPEGDNVAEVQITDGKPSDDPNAEVEFDVRVNFRPLSIPPRVLKVRAPLKGESQPQIFEVEAARDAPVDMLVRIFQANTLIQSLRVEVKDEATVKGPA
jgi:hypothetical protein